MWNPVYDSVPAYLRAQPPPGPSDGPDWRYRPVSDHGFEEDKDGRRMVFRRDPSTGLWTRGQAWYDQIDAWGRRDLRGTEHEWDGPGAYHSVSFPDGTRYVHERHLHARLRDDSGVDYSDLNKFLEEGL